MKRVFTGGLRPKKTQKSGVTEATTLSLQQVAQLSGISETDLSALVRSGVLMPVLLTSSALRFGIGCVMALQRAQNLRQELALDAQTFSQAVVILNRAVGIAAASRA